MKKDVSKSFESHFGDLKDPRIERTKRYPLSDILFVVLTGSVCGAESWRDYVLFGEERLDFLSIPRVMRGIDKKINLKRFKVRDISRVQVIFNWRFEMFFNFFYFIDN